MNNSLDLVVIYRDQAKEWRWNRKSRNGRILADSAEGYKNVNACLEMAQRVNAQDYKLVIVSKDADGTELL